MSDKTVSAARATAELPQSTTRTGRDGRTIDTSNIGNARARRNQTRTERLYYVGCRYNREKGPEGANQHTRRRQPDAASDRARERIAREERLSPKTVERAAKMAAHIDQACACGLAFLKWPPPPARAAAEAAPVTSRRSGAPAPC